MRNKKSSYEKIFVFQLPNNEILLFSLEFPKNKETFNKT